MRAGPAWTGWPMYAGASRRDGLSGEEEIDRRVLLGLIDELRFEEEELDELSWSPISYSYLLGGGLFSLLSREFAPLRLGSRARPAGWRGSATSSTPRART